MKFLFLVITFLFLKSSTFYTIAQFETLLHSNEQHLADILTNYGYSVVWSKDLNYNRNLGYIQFENNNKEFPSVDVNFTDNKLESIRKIEMRTNNLKLENLIKFNTKKVKTFFNKKVGNYVTQYESNKAHFYLYSFNNIYKEKYYVVVICKKTTKLKDF